MANANSYRSGRGVFVGIFIVAIGIVFLLNEEGIVSASYMFRFFWPTIFIFFGLETVISCKAKGSRGLVGSLLLAFGLLLLLGAFDVLHVGLHTLWPVLLILWGVGDHSSLRARRKLGSEGQRRCSREV